jgi:hypothetical protein
MPNARHARSVLSRIARRLDQPCVWWHPYESSFEQKRLGQSISQTESAISFQNAIHALVTIIWPSHRETVRRCHVVISRPVSSTTPSTEEPLKRYHP